jgi:membrane dipeptidase
MAPPLCLIVSFAAWTVYAEADERARKLHFDSIVVDTHDDTTQRLLDPDFDLGVRHDDGSIDLPRAREGGLDAIFFSIWIPGTVTGAPAVEHAREQIAAIHRQIDTHPGELALATTADDVRRIAAGGRIAALIGVEGGHMIANDLANLRELYALGARYMTLTHSENVDWADSSTDEPRLGGLNDFGRAVVAEMNRLGMIVDVSHVSDDTFADVLEFSTAPVIASHSSSRALCDVPRNMSDRMIRALAERGGVIQINYHVGFLSKAFDVAIHADDGRLDKEIEAEGARRCGQKEACMLLTGDALMREYVVAGKLPRVGWQEIVAHIDHVVRLVGADHVGLGSDFDGAYMPFGLENAALLPKLTVALLAKGYSEQDIRNILGGNTLRVMEQVEAVAARANAAAVDQGKRPPPRSRRAIERNGLRTTILRPHDNGIGELVVPALLARIERHPEEPQAERQQRDVIAEVPDHELASRRLSTGLRVDDSRMDQHLARRRLARDPERDHRDGGHQIVEQHIGGPFDEAHVVPVPGVDHVQHRQYDNAQQHRVHDARAKPRPEPDVLEIVEVIGHGNPSR